VSLKSELRVRTLTALVLIPAVLALVFLGKIYFFLLIVAAFALAQWEFLNLFGVKKALKWYSVFLLGASLFAFSFNLIYLIALCPLLLFLAIPLMWNKGISIKEFALTFFILVYMWMGAASALLIRTRMGYQGILFFLFVIWIFDSMAYIGGYFLGKHKLAEKISPKKTIEGYVYGILFTIPFGYILYHIKVIPPGTTLASTIALTVFISILSQIGDLVESAFKREAGVKDSSNLFPGHGGMLDRVDSIVFTAPYFAIITRILGLWR